MRNIFSGLEALGIKGTEKVDIFNDSTTEKKEKKKEEKQEKKEVKEEDLIFDKKYTCPVCDHDFTSKAVRTGKVRIVSTDADLRPNYKELDPLKYDAVLCPQCGYAALNRYWTFVMPAQAKIIWDKISQTFENTIDEEEEVYSYDSAITRHKMALLNTVVKNGKNSERAYTCLKLAWLCRGKREMLMHQKTGFDKKEVAGLLKEEKDFLENAFKGFEAAFSREDFPMCGMDQYTMMYLLAELARRVGEYESSQKYVSKILVSRNVNSRIKDKAYDLREKLKGKGHEEENK